MADNIVVVGLQPGDDYTTLTAANAAIPADLTTTGFDNWRIRIRNDQVYGQLVPPTTVTDETHRLIYEAFPGDETNGKGEGPLIQSNSTLGAVRLNSGSVNYVELDGLSVDQTGTNRGVYAQSQNASIVNCFLKSASGDTVEIPNAGGSALNIDNVIAVNSAGNRVVDFGSGGDGTTRTINRITAIGGTGLFTLDRVTSSEAQARKVNYTNCLAFAFGGQTFRAVSSTSPIFESDFNATDDNLGTVNSLTTGFNGRISTDDLEDPLGITPDYNLKSTSTLKGAGSGGSDVGATLGAITPPPSYNTFWNQNFSQVITNA